MPADRAFVDTNVLIYALDPDSIYFSASAKLIERAQHPDAQLYVSPQVFTEFFSVVTDRRRSPKPRSPIEALDAIEVFMSLPGLTLLPVPADITLRWMALARRYPTTGPSIFDMHLAATMLAYDIPTVYTYNRADFESIEGITVRSPDANA